MKRTKGIVRATAFLSLFAICGAVSAALTPVMTDIGTLGGALSIAQDVNDSGQVVGFASSGTEGYPFLYQDGTMVSLPAPGGLDHGGIAYGINASGQVTGEFDVGNGTSRAFLYTGGTSIDLGTVGGYYSSGHAINDAGDIVGVSVTTAGYFHAFYRPAATGVMVDIGSLEGGPSVASECRAYDINEDGWIVGWSTTPSGDEYPDLPLGVDTPVVENPLPSSGGFDVQEGSQDHRDPHPLAVGWSRA